MAAGGVAVVAVLVLRAMGEWRRLEMPEADDDGPDADGEGEDDGRSGGPGLSP